jgi:hypothetical protein
MQNADRCRGGTGLRMSNAMTLEGAFVGERAQDVQSTYAIAVKVRILVVQPCT